MPRNQSPRSPAAGFTLIEMLVVIAVIALLASILMPSMNTAMERAKAAACKSNLRQLGIAVMSFAADNQQRLPGSYGNSANRNVKNGGPFVGREVLIPEASYTLWLSNADEVGTLTAYIAPAQGDARRAYRCPSLPQGELDSGVGSNGMFDYKFIKAFSGVKLDTIPPHSTLEHDGRTVTLPTPVFLEEDPRDWSNNFYIDPGFSNADRLGTWHLRNSGHYIAIDGSVHVFHSKRAGQGPRCFSWRAGGTTPFWDSNISYAAWKPL